MTQDTIFACDELAELTKENSMLKVQNRELLARCDFLEAELKQYEAEVSVLLDQLGG